MIDAAAMDFGASTGHQGGAWPYWWWYTQKMTYALEAHDLALAKLERNSERDRDDVQRLARAGHLDRETLRRRYVEELRPYLSRETWHDQTMQLWIESCWPDTPQLGSV